ncbi:SDR family NAD(P)-dependent oxidoreductase [Kitasatospora sp. NPDC088134]|uniref:SDR family NAD(P)-dependent oxidoreductase n=1 Tax=Kitasatospora sp. NPDC088134 TaxID=3364071 RepID=UPI0037FF181F
MGATGDLGGRVAVAAAARGARVVPAGRDPERLAALVRRLGAPGAERFDAYRLDTCAGLAARAAERLGGLDAVLVTVGVAAFGPADLARPEIEEHLAAVNALAPIAVLRGALGVVGPGAAVGAVTGVVVARPLAGAGAYRASKAALTAWLETARLEQRRRRVAVLEARPPHLANGFAGRAVAGNPPPLPAGADPQSWAEAALDALLDGAALVRPGPDGRPVREPGRPRVRAEAGPGAS